MLRRHWVTPLLLVSVLGLLVQDLGFVLIARTSAIPTAGWILQGVVLAIAIALLWLSRRAAARGWLH